MSGSGRVAVNDEECATCELTVRGLPVRVRETLAARATVRGQSLNAYLAELLALLAATPPLANALGRLETPRRVIDPDGAGGDDIVTSVREVRDERISKWDRP